MLTTPISIDEELHCRTSMNKTYENVGELLKDAFFLRHYFNPTQINTKYWADWSATDRRNQSLFNEALCILNALKRLPRVRIPSDQIEDAWLQLRNKL